MKLISGDEDVASPLRFPSLINMILPLFARRSRDAGDSLAMVLVKAQ
jgi:hypothetical protein